MHLVHAVARQSSCISRACKSRMGALVLNAFSFPGVFIEIRISGLVYEYFWMEMTNYPEKDVSRKLFLCDLGSMTLSYLDFQATESFFHAPIASALYGTSQSASERKAQVVRGARHMA